MFGFLRNTNFYTNSSPYNALYFSVEASLEHVPFKKLDFGSTSVLEEFYNADVVVVDMTIPVQQSALFYHIGVRQSMGMKHNIVLFYDTDVEQSLSLKVSFRSGCVQTVEFSFQLNVIKI